MLVQQIEALQEYLSTPKRVVITTHHKPDADALGSSLGFARYLQKKGHDVSIPNLICARPLILFVTFELNCFLSKR